MKLMEAALPTKREEGENNRLFKITYLTRIFAIFLGVLLPVTGQALDFTYTSDNGSITITGYTGPGGNVIIPGTIEGLPVISIGGNAFNWSSYLTSLTVPEGVTNIGDRAFYFCCNLTNITFATTLTHIGDNAFYNCAKLGTITLPDGITSIGSEAFSYCGGLTSLVIPEGITNISSFAFSDCYGLTNITLPTTLVSIGDDAFAGCKSLPGVLLPKSVTSIESYSFGYCDSLTSIAVPDAVTNLGSYAFYQCTSLTNILLSTNLSNLGDNAFNSCGSLAGITLPKLLTNIGEALFFGCNGLTSIVIPNSVTNVGWRAFSCCGQLTSIMLSTNLSTVGNYAFASCSNLVDVTIPGTVTSIGYSSFNSCRSLTNLVFSNGITNIGSYAFANCSGLTCIAFPLALARLDDCTFSGCIGLTNVIFSESLTSIGYSTFENCSNLNSIVIPDTISNLGSLTFYNCLSLTNVTLSTNLSTISYGTFSNCRDLTDVKIPSGVTEIQGSAFSACTSLQGIVIPRSVIKIGDYAFNRCASMTAITVDELNPAFMSDSGVLYDKNQTTLIQYPAAKISQNYIIPNSVREIKMLAFTGCNSLVSVTIPESITSVLGYTFSECSNLTKIFFQGNAPLIGYWPLVTGMNNTFIYYLSGTKGWGRAFGGCLTVPEDYAFTVASGTVTITAYTGTNSSVSIPPIIRDLAVTSLGDSVFSSNCNMITVSIPASITNIGNKSFYACTNLAGVHFEGNCPRLGNSVFDFDNKVTLYYLPGSTGWTPLIEGYPTMEQDFFYTTNGNSITITCNRISGGSLNIPSSIDGLPVTQIRAYAFCSSATNASIPSTVTNIGSSAFGSCSYLNSISVDAQNPSYSSQDGVLFNKNQTALLCYPANRPQISYTVPASVIEIDSEAFQYCGILRDLHFQGNAFDIETSALAGAPNATVYYLAGTSGWGSYFGGRPTARIDYTYTSNGESITLTGYQGPGGDVVIPSIIDELPVWSIGENVFSGCSSLTNITFQNGVRSIGAHAFSSCTNLISITMPLYLTNIGDAAFSFCTSLTDVHFQGNAPSIGDSIFYGSDKVTVYYRPGTTGWGTTFGGRPTSRQDYNYVVNNGTVTITSYLGNDTVVIVPSTINGLPVTSIGRYAFNPRSLLSITIPAGVTSLSDSAFGDSNYNCMLKEIFFQGNAPSVSWWWYAGNGDTVIYYLDGTTGWNNTLGHNPTQLWDPTVPYKYTTNGGTITITGYIGTDAVRVVPSTIQGLPVTDIGNSAFASYGILTAISLPGSLNNIGSKAFYSCLNLTNITIASGVTNIGSEAFNSCSALTAIIIPDTVKNIGDWCFINCSSLTKATLSNGLSELAWGIFESCTQLPCITIPNSVKSLKDSSFHNCTSLTNVTFGSNVTEIGAGAFFGCTNLPNLSIPSTVRSIGNDAFGNCHNLSSIDVDQMNPEYCSVGGVLFNKQRTLLIAYPNTTPATTYTIPSSVRTIGTYAFSGSLSLTNLVIPNNVINLEGGAFTSCANLQNVVLPTHLTNISDRLFWNCTGLTSITIPNGVTSIGTFAFWECTSLTNIIFPQSLQNICYGAFDECSGLTSLRIPRSVTSIENAAFYACTSLTEVFFEGNAPTVGDVAFMNWFKPVTIYYLPGTKGWPGYFEGAVQIMRSSDYACSIHNGEVTIEGYCGYDKVISLPSRIGGLPVTHIATAAFYGCTNLTKVTIPSSVSEIGDSAFFACSSLTNVLFSTTNGVPPKISGLGNWVFYDCSNLTSFTIPNSVTFLGDQTFQGCSMLTNLTIPEKVSQIGDSIFANCSKLSAITVASSNASFSGLGGVLFNKNKTRLLVYPSNKADSDYTIPNSVTSIAAEAFLNCIRLKTLTVPSSVMSIGMAAFASSGLTEVYFNGNAPATSGPLFAGTQNTTIYCLQDAAGWGGTSFSGCPLVYQNFSYTVSKKTICINGYTGSGVVRIPEEINGLPVTAISHFIADVVEVQIPGCVTNIVSQALSDCVHLSAITVDGNNPNYCSVNGVLFNKRQTSLLAYPRARTGSYTMPSTVKNIGAYAFLSCSNLAGVTIPTGVTNLEVSAFDCCTGLRSVALPSTVTFMATRAFAGCSNLWSITVDSKNRNFSSFDGVVFNTNNTTLLLCPAGRAGAYTIPSGVLTVGSEAFSLCSRLTEVTVPKSVTRISDRGFDCCTNLTRIYFQGDAPSLGKNIFNQDSTLTVYYYSGAKNWGPTFGSRPAVCIDLTLPRLTITSPKEGLRTTNSIYSFAVLGTTSDDTAVSNVFYRINKGDWLNATTTNAWMRWSGTARLSQGTNTIEAFAMDTSYNCSPISKTSFLFTPLAPLNISHTGLGTLTPAYTNGQLLALGACYSITATAGGGYLFSNWTGGFPCSTNVIKFTMVSNTVVCANFIPNPFTAIAGNYWGLFTNASEFTTANCGGFSAIVKTNGSFSGKLYQGATNYPLTGNLQLSLSGWATNSVAINHTNLTVVLCLDDGQISGSVSGGQWTSDLNAIRNSYSTNNKAALAGNYTMVVPGAADTSTNPGGYSVAAVSVSTVGAVTVLGYAADGEVITCGTGLSKEGRWPLYASLSGGGVIIGWEILSHNSSNAVSGVINWINPNKVAPYSFGFNYQSTNVFGSIYTNRPSPLGFTNGVLTFTESMVLPIEYHLKLSSAGMSNSVVRMVLTLGNGLFTGTFVNSSSKLTNSFTGVLLQNENVGVGAFRSKNQTGELLLDSQ